MANSTFYLLQIIGVISFSISGAMVAIKKNADMFGVVVLGVITAMGGGVTRDIFLGITPPSLFENYVFVLCEVASALLVFLFAYVFKEKYLAEEEAIEKINNVVDAIGLGIFAVAGVRITLEAGFTDNHFLIISMGTITATVGGIVRDLMIMEIPFVLKKRVYAVAAIIGSSVYFYSIELGLNDTVAMISCTLVTFAIRMLATVFKWDFPKALGKKSIEENNEKAI